MTDLEAKAESYFAERRVKLAEVIVDSDQFARLVFHVQGSDTEPYYVKARRQPGETHWTWTCDCPARVDLCSHVRAAQMGITTPLHVRSRETPRDPGIDEILGI